MIGLILLLAVLLNSFLTTFSASKGRFLSASVSLIAGILCLVAMSEVSYG